MVTCFLRQYTSRVLQWAQSIPCAAAACPEEVLRARKFHKNRSTSFFKYKDGSCSVLQVRHMPLIPCPSHKAFHAAGGYGNTF